MGVRNDDLERHFDEMFDAAPDPADLLSEVVDTARTAAKRALLARGGHVIATVTATNADVTEYWVIESDEPLDQEQAHEIVTSGHAALLYDTVDDNEEGREVIEVEGP